MANSIHPRLKLLDPAMDALMQAARETGLQVAKFARDRSLKAYRTLQPGTDTPLWNELRRRVASQLGKRGEKVLLARFLGISRQRLHLMIKTGAACPDAERTLLLLAWVIAREQARDLS
jgi:hypothetical protein